MGVKTSIGFIEFFIGALSGGALVHFFANKTLKNRVKELELQNDDLIAENQKLNAFKREMKKKNVGHEKKEKENDNAETPRIKRIKKDISHEESAQVSEDPRPGNSNLNVKINYAKLSKEYRSDSFDEHFASRVGPTDDEDDEDDEDEDEEDEKDEEEYNSESSEIGNKTIRIISSEDFQNDLEYRDNETLTYYQLDDVLVDSGNRKIVDEESVIGKECVGLISSMPQPEGTENLDDDVDIESFVYVDNEIEDKIYEIIVNHNQNFYRDFAGGYY